MADRSEYVQKAVDTEEVEPELENLNDDEKAFLLENAGEMNYLIHMVHSDPLNGAPTSFVWHLYVSSRT